MNGAIVHNLRVIGGPVDIGDEVSVDYTTPEPTIIAVSKSWLTDDDLQRALKKIPVPLSPRAIREYDNFILTQLDDVSKTKWIPIPGWVGLSYIQDYAWDLQDEFGSWPDLVIRWPPGLVYYPSVYENMAEWYDGGVLCANIGESRDSTMFLGAWATQLNGNWFENISFFSASTYTYVTAYNFYLWENAAPLDYADQRISGNQDWISRNCRFVSQCMLDGDDQLVPYEINMGIPYSNFWIYDSVAYPLNMYFYDCEFYSRTNTRATIKPHAIYFEGGADQENINVYLYNCLIDAGDNPFSNEDWDTMDEGYGGNFGHLHVYAYNCQWIDLDGSPLDPSTIPNLTILDDGDRSPIVHSHSGGTGVDSSAVHLSEAGQWL
jgi:hypothetical protein